MWREETKMISKYSKGAVILHWMISALIISNIAFAMLPLPKPTHEFLMGLHLSFGIIILFLAVARIVWRLTHKPPAKPADLAGWEVFLSRAVHFLFYALMILVPLSGWVWMTAEGYPVDMFGLFNMPGLPVEKSKELADIMHERHELLGLVTLGLVVLHIAGALKHQYFDRMPFIQRMWP
jgi:cytochrome b561